MCMSPNKKYTGTWYTNQYKQQYYCTSTYIYICTYSGGYSWPRAGLATLRGWSILLCYKQVVAILTSSIHIYRSSAIIVPVCCTNKTKLNVRCLWNILNSTSSIAFSCMDVFPPNCKYTVVMSILWQFVQNIKCDPFTRISDIKCANFWLCPCWDYLQKRKTPRYLSVITVIGSRVRASDTVSSSRDVRRG